VIILSLAERDPETVSRLLTLPPQGAEAIEVRLDLLARREPHAWYPGPAGCAVPVIATCRRTSEGGKFRGTEKAREEYLLEAARAGVAYVDVERAAPAAKRLREMAPAKVILSHHDRLRTPRATVLWSIYRKMAAVPGVSIVKIVTTARDPLDILEIRRLLERARGAAVPVAAFAMGETGKASRILAPVWGSWATYVSLERGRESAPGQITLREATDVYRVAEIDEETRIVGIAGDPVSHSLSPVMHNAAFHRQGINFRYLPFAAPRAGNLLPLVRRLKIRGLSVTAPHKIAIARKLRLLDPLAIRMGAINTIVNDGKRILGFSTDAEGLMNPLRERIDPAGRIAVVLGAGGSARAIALALRSAGATLIVSSRRERPGKDLARVAGGTYVPPRRLVKTPYDILVNATPAGMDGRSMAIRTAAIRGSLVADLVYSPLRTPLLLAAVKKGIPILDGLDVLLAQGIAQYALFTGRLAPAEDMRRAIRAATLRGEGAGA